LFRELAIRWIIFVLEALNMSKGNFSPEVVQRRGQSVQPLKDLRTALQKEMINDDFVRGRTTRYGKSEMDVEDAVQVIMKNRLLEHRGKRHHDGKLY
jgi:hypothetical protein